MDRFRVIRAAWILVVVCLLTAPSVGRAQSAAKKGAPPKQPDRTKANSADPSPQEVFARLFVAGPSQVVGVESVPYGAGVEAAGASRVSGPSASSARHRAVGPRGFTPREAKLVVKENTLLHRQTTLIARLQKLESIVSVRAVPTTTTPVQRAEMSVAAQLNANQVLIMKNLAILSTLAPDSPAVQAEYSSLSTQAQAIGYQAGQALTQAGLPTGDRFPATASR